MSKNINVNPGNYKVAGRERQGEDIIHDVQKQTYSRHRVDTPSRVGKKREPRPAAPSRRNRG